MGVQASARANVERGWDGATRGKNAPNLGQFIFHRGVEKRVQFILLEQLLAFLHIQGKKLLALLRILGLAGRLGLNDAGLTRAGEGHAQDFGREVARKGPSPRV